MYVRPSNVLGFWVRNHEAYQMATIDGAKPIPQQGCGLYKFKRQGSVEEASCTSAQVED